RTPVDVEKTTVDGSFPILQNIQPPRIVAAHDRHVIRDNIEDHSHTVFAENAYKIVELFTSPNLWIERVVIDNVVSMKAAGAGLETGRKVTVTDAESGKIGHD